MPEQLEFCFDAPAPGNLFAEVARRVSRKEWWVRSFQRKHSAPALSADCLVLWFLAHRARSREKKRQSDIRSQAKHREKMREYFRCYCRSEHGKAKRKLWWQSEGGRSLRKKWNAMPKVKAAQKQWRQSIRAQILKQIRAAETRAKKCLVGKRRNRFLSEAAIARMKRLRDKQYAMAQRLRTRIRGAILRRGLRKSLPTASLLGCSIQEFVAHLEKHFLPGMTWENRHLWDIDHVTPCRAFDLRREDEQRRCFHFSNLKPLWKPQNAKKWGKMPTPRQIPLLPEG